MRLLKLMDFFWNFALIALLINFLIKEASFSNALVFISMISFFLIKEYLQQNKINEKQEILDKLEELNTKVQAFKLQQTMRSSSNGTQKNNANFFTGAR